MNGFYACRRVPIGRLIGILLVGALTVCGAEPEVDVRQNGQSVFVGNRHIGIGFTQKNGALQLSSIADMAKAHEYLQASSPIWGLIFTNGGRLDSNTAGGTQSVKVEKSDDANAATIRLLWQNMDLKQEKGVVDVEVTMTIQAGSPLSRWRIAVKNRANGFGLNRIEFPTVSPFGGGDGAPKDFIAYPGGWGKRIDNPESAANLSMLYPEVSMTMQFFAYGIPGKGALYYAAHDGDANVKYIRIAGNGKGKGVSARWSVIPENVNRPKVDFSMNYDMIIGVLDGDWYDCAKVYRDWALKQKWCGKGKIKDRSDYSRKFKEYDLWMLHHAGDKIHPADVKLMKTARRATVFSTGESAEIIKSFQKSANAPIAVHWYLWHQIPFDNGYPDYFPAWDGFKPAVAALKQDNIPVMPYINGRLWDTATTSFQQENAGATAVFTGAATRIEGYGGKKHAVMCPFTGAWQAKLNGIATRLADEYQVGGLYLDQIGAAFPCVCLNPKHGHPLGGGHHWVDGYRAMLQTMRDNIKKNHPDFFLTTEGQAEPYIDLFEGSLMYNLSAGRFIPLFPAVYSQYASTFGNIYRMENTAAGRCALIAQSLTAGAQLGWVSSDFMADREFADYLRNCTETRRRNREFLMNGEMLRPLMLPGQNGIFSSVWRADDGKVAVVLANPTAKPKTFELKLNRADYGLATAGECLMTEDGNDANVRKFASDMVEESVVLAPFSNKVLILSAQGKSTAAPAAAEAAVGAFLSVRSNPGAGIGMADGSGELSGELLAHRALPGALRIRLESSAMKFTPEYIELAQLQPGEPTPFKFTATPSATLKPGVLECRVVIEDAASKAVIADATIGAIVHSLSYRKPYQKSEEPHKSYGDAGNREMTDGIYAGAYQDGKSCGYPIKNMETKEVSVTVDLGAEKPVAHFQHRNCGVWNYYPDALAISVSKDGKEWKFVGEHKRKGAKALQVDSPEPLSARFVEFKFSKTRNHPSQDFMFVDELDIW